MEAALLFWSVEFQELSAAASHAHEAEDRAESRAAMSGPRADRGEARTASIVALDTAAAAGDGVGAVTGP